MAHQRPPDVASDDAEPSAAALPPEPSTPEVALPLLTDPLGGIPHVIETERDLQAAAEAIAGGEGSVALDAERASGYRYSQRAYLVQVRREGAGTASNPAFKRPGQQQVLDAVNASQASSTSVNAVLVRLAPGADAAAVANTIARAKRFTVFTRAQMQEVLVSKLIATSAKQIGMFLVILAAVSAAIVAFIIYTLTMDKIREIAVLKLIGTRNRTIAWMILQQALALGLIGFAVGKISATFSAPIFPKYVLLLPQDSVAALAAVLAICALASVVAIRIALRIDPAEAIG